MSLRSLNSQRAGAKMPMMARHSAAHVLLLSLLLLPAVPAQRAHGQGLDPGVNAELVLTPVVRNLGSPTAAQFLPDGRMVIAQQTGEILLWNGTGDPVVAGTVPVDPALGERGLLGLAIDPEFNTSNRIYFYYSADGVDPGVRNRVAYAILNPADNTLDVANRVDILANIYGPANHDGGGIVFGPDGLLYIGAGDTGCNCSCDPGTNTNNFFPTCLTTLQGKILRITRDGEIPAGNPLVGVGAVPRCGTEVNCGLQGARWAPQTSVTAPPRLEIYLWGFRNPWRFSFDSQTGYLWIGDVGEISFEEITVSKRGGEHHGWPFREGAHGQEVTACASSTPMSGNCVEPVFEIDQAEQPSGQNGSVTGGVFSNHCSWPDGWRGRYWFGDYSKNRIWTATPNAARDGVEPGSRTTIVVNARGPVHFFNGPDGSVYFVSIDVGGVFQLRPVNPLQCVEPDAGVMRPDAQVVAVDASASSGGGKTDGCSCNSMGTDLPIAAYIAGLCCVGIGAYFRRRPR